MASEESEVTNDALVNRFHEYAEFSDKKDKNKFTSAACGKMIRDALLKDLSKYDVKGRVEGSAFPHFAKANGGKFFAVNENNVKAFVRKCAHELAKRKTGNEKILDDAKEVLEMEKKIKNCIGAQGPIIAGTKTSKTGGVGHLTDSSKYTGASKERFDDHGKGKGKAGRETLVDDSGYVQGSKIKDTHVQKKK